MGRRIEEYVLNNIMQPAAVAAAQWGSGGGPPLAHRLSRQLVPDAHSKAISVLNHDIALLEFLLHRLTTGV